MLLVFQLNFEWIIRSLLYNVSSVCLPASCLDMVDGTVFFSYYRSGDHDFIGSCTTTLREIVPEKYGHIDVVFSSGVHV